MVNRIRNRECVPYIATEGDFLKPLLVEKAARKNLKCSGSTVFNRLSKYHTLASARRYAYFKPNTHLVPRDALDFVLSSSYSQTHEHFPETVDVYFQPETLGINTWRRLRNTRDLTPDREEQATAAKKGEEDAAPQRSTRNKQKQLTIPFRYNVAHKVLIGGVTEKKHPSNVKLINSSHHSPQTNGGYSRQPSDGNFYQY